MRSMLRVFMRDGFIDRYSGERLVFPGIMRALSFYMPGEIPGKLRDEVLNGEIFYSLWEAQVFVERWRKEYNRFCPHSSLGYRPPAPEPIEPPPLERAV